MPGGLGMILIGERVVALAGLSGRRHLRKLLCGHSFGPVQLGDNLLTDNQEPRDRDYPGVVHLDHSEYTEVR